MGVLILQYRSAQSSPLSPTSVTLANMSPNSGAKWTRWAVWFTADRTNMRRILTWMIRPRFDTYYCQTGPVNATLDWNVVNIASPRRELLPGPCGPEGAQREPEGARGGPEAGGQRRLYTCWRALQADQPWQHVVAQLQTLQSPNTLVFILDLY